jgi:hypothetical protein
MLHHQRRHRARRPNHKPRPARRTPRPCGGTMVTPANSTELHQHAAAAGPELALPFVHEVLRGRARHSPETYGATQRLRGRSHSRIISKKKGHFRYNVLCLTIASTRTAHYTALRRQLVMQHGRPPLFLVGAVFPPPSRGVHHQLPGQRAARATAESVLQFWRQPKLPRRTKCAHLPFLPTCDKLVVADWRGFHHSYLGRVTPHHSPHKQENVSWLAEARGL